VRIPAAAVALLLAGGAATQRAPRVEPQGLAFWDLRHGLVTGYELQSKRSVVLLTSDGGRTWRTVRRGIGPYALAAVRGGSDGWIAMPGALLHTRDRGRTWSTFSRARIVEPSFATPLRGWAFARGRLVGTDDGGVVWRALRQPCARSVDPTPKLSLATPTHGWILCLSQPGTGQQPKALYESRDGGRSWRLRASSLFGRPRRGNLPTSGYGDGISFLDDGHGWLPETRGAFYETRSGGSYWRPLPISKPEVVEAHAAELLSDHEGVALVFYDRRLAVTTDGGRTWRYVTRFR
jgi:photosystem II stability/assembly factor-like uncharacterized protein